MSSYTFPRTSLLFAMAIGLSGVMSSSATGQSALKQPAELPPAGFAGNEFVDSTGCMFIRAGVTGAVTWVPRVTQDRKQICSFEPSFPVATIPEPSPALSPETKTEETVKTVSAPAPATGVAPTTSTVTPKPRPQITPTKAQPSAAPEPRFVPAHIAEALQNQRPVTVPKGYRSAWQDGRLNPRRAEQTLSGQAQMRAIWTDTVPRRLIEP
jgi:hypothetical protein